MKPIEIDLTHEEREELERWLVDDNMSTRMRGRAEIILDAVAGVKAMETATRLNVYPYVVSKWRRRFRDSRIAGLFDGDRPGKPSKYRDDAEKRVLEVVRSAPPEGCMSWNGRLVAERVGDVSPDFVWRVMRKHKIVLQRCSRFMEQS